MNKTGIASAFTTFLITGCTALISLFSQSGVELFSDISEVAYAAAGLGALVAGATTYKARMADKPDPFNIKTIN